MLTKFIAPTTGTITFNGRDITAKRPADVARLGLVRSFQISAVFPNLTALENVRIALARARGDSFDFWRSKTVLESAERARARTARRAYSGPRSPFQGRRDLLRPKARAGTRDDACGSSPEMMLLDEPMAGMGHEDIDRVAALIQPRVGEPDDPDGRAQSAESSPTCRTSITVLYPRAGAGRGRLPHRVRRTREVREAYMGAGHG